MDRVLITGGMGFIGSHLAHRLLEAGREVWVLDLSETPFTRVLRDYDRFHMVVDTIRNRPILQRLVDRVDCVAHLAAVVNPAECARRPRKVMDVTLLAALEIVEMIRWTDKLFLFTSTSEIYGRSEGVPFREDDDRVLGSVDVNRWCYSTSKAAVEHYIKACQLEGQLDYVIGRVFNAYGPRLRHRVVDAFVDAALRGDPLVVHGDGSQTRCFTYIDDVVDAFVRLLDVPEAHNASYNVGDPREVTIRDLAHRVIELTGASPNQIEYENHLEAIGDSYEDIPRRVPAIERIGDAVDWSPRIGLDEGLRRMIEYRRAELAAEAPRRRSAAARKRTPRRPVSVEPALPLR